ncbi:c-type cytochrome biogenesis protein CcmI [Exilibacterium tricleocarpae]|uniref:C-type cytochrome biogenesis protein CcmI n=1 Tax=Exilibacterium tricleocarpae TaxID=2591008 RepID=A0A545TLT2_9GAMM|nr:c-type cytochrome biogenesis protein CcmI [Exilibacterium tricleocarpae]TQV78154.1 c-type cytochrome biogenesis protein CcmI [Exilibacterium tricleocarpae]
MALLWAGFVVLALGAMVFVLWPVLRQMVGPVSGEGGPARGRSNVELYRQHVDELAQAHERGDIDADQFQQLKLEADRALLEDSAPQTDTGAAPARGRWARANTGLVVTALAVPLATVWLYFQLGASEDWAIEQMALENRRQSLMDQHTGKEPDRERVQALVTRLQQRLAAQPDNLQNWFLLARTALELQDYDAATTAYRAIIERDPSASRVMAELAQTLFLAADNRITPEVERLVAQTLNLDPNNDMALGLAGIAAFHRAEYQTAIDFWQRALARLAPDAPSAMALTGGIGRARQLLVAGAAEPGAEVAPAAAGSAGEPGLQVKLNVSLGKQITTRAEQVVFVYARAWQGPKMPLAIARFPVADLPREVVLDESMAMAPGMTLASFPQLELVARLSQSGQPAPQPGDWQATRGPVSAAELSGAVELVIDTQIP